MHSAKRRQKNPISKEKDENYWKQRGHQEDYKSTLSQKTAMNARGSEKGVKRFTTTMEWSEEIGMDPTTKAFEPGHRVVERSLTRKSEAQAGDSIRVKGRCWRCNQEGHSGHA